MLDPAARHSAPNHSCPPRLSVTISSGNFCLNSLVALPPGPSSSSSILLQMLSSLSWHDLSLDTREAQRSGSFRPSKESSSAATRLRLSSAYLWVTSMWDCDTTTPSSIISLFTRISQAATCHLSSVDRATFVRSSWLRGTRELQATNLYIVTWQGLLCRIGYSAVMEVRKEGS